MHSDTDAPDQQAQSDESGTSRRSFLRSVGVLSLASAVGLQVGSGSAAAQEGGAGSFVGGGDGNVASGEYAAVPGGQDNVASVIHSVVGGGLSNVSRGNKSVVCGGRRNVASGQETFVGGGENNTASGNAALVAGGSDNTASGLDATVSGGFNNQATGFEATIAGGASNTSSGSRSYVGGGNNNEASARYATTGGGFNNAARGYGSIAPGGEANVAEGSYSYAAGRQAQALNTGAFVWADNSGGTVASTGPNQFVVRAAGGFYFGDDNEPTLQDGLINTSTGAHLTVGGTWANASSVARKTDFSPVDPEEILESVRELPVRSWQYEDEPGDTRHVGPTAEAFDEAFEFGEGSETIATVDADGVALAAVQALAERNERLEARLETLESNVEDD